MYREVSYGTENLDCIMCPFCYACFCHYGGVMKCRKIFLRNPRLLPISAVNTEK